ncbi:DUF599 domain-containing protein [Aquabacterium soli]|jgi:hypothetical protein|uniref:DUF599 domain-containing protein n=1 Tax=Aquabacterium soli TaxID=2493092 RepID=A0A3R8U6S6_9BURK|nr:DUF599 domain-containing protein [Aquabacterium soli]RRS05846.1 DUF599 domain-containing protein [Aquabacterium soli]
MSAAPLWTWLAAGATLVIVLLYEALQWLPGRNMPDTLSRAAHARLRAAWLNALAEQPGSEILAVQTLRNSLMSSTLTASTAAIGLMGTVTLIGAPLLNHEPSEPFAFTPRLMLELALMATLFAALACSTMAVRYYNHASFIGALPVGSNERAQWQATGVTYLRRAGVLYSWGLRGLLMVAPLVAGVAHPLAGPIAALALVAVLVGFDRFSA